MINSFGTARCLKLALCFWMSPFSFTTSWDCCLFLCVFPQEICLNPRNPASVVTVVSPKNVTPQWGLPEVSYQFTTRWWTVMFLVLRVVLCIIIVITVVRSSYRSELDKLANNSACDIIGLVTFVGRVERVKSKGNKGKIRSYLILTASLCFQRLTLFAF